MTHKKPRGFAALSREKRQALASLGGQAGQAQGTAHRWASDEARIAGAKGRARRRDLRRDHTKGGA